MKLDDVEEAHQIVLELLTYDSTRQDELQMGLEDVDDLLQGVIDAPYEDSVTAVDTETLATMAFSLAPEVLEKDDVDMNLPGEDPDFPPVYKLVDSWEDVDTYVDPERGFGIHFHGTEEAVTSRRVARATRWQPAEYAHDSHEVLWTLEYYPADNDGFGSARFTAR